jgi:hypothetical protein
MCLASYPPYGEANQRKPRPDFTNLFCAVTDAPADYEHVVEVSAANNNDELNA